MTHSPTDSSGLALANRVLLITGATNGFGKALALQCVRLGATVIAHGRNQKKLEQLDDECFAATGKRMALLPLDLEKAVATDYDAMIQAIDTNFGRLDALVHNAAMLAERAPVEHHDVAKWLRAMHVNTNAPFILTRYCLPLLKKSSQASLVFVSCELATQAKAHWGAYLVSKWANEGMRQMLTEELANTHINVSSFDPSVMNTKLRMQAYPGETREQLPLPEVAAAKLADMLIR